MNHASRNAGITLIELLIVIAIIGIIAALVTLDAGWFQREGRVTEARDRLVADIEDVKLKSLAQVPHAIKIINSTSYKIVKLNDTNSNFKWDSGEDTTDIDNSTVTLATNVKISGPSGSLLWFDRKGNAKSSTWGVGNTTFTIWYDSNGNGTYNVSPDDDGEISKTIIISDTGRIQYEKR